MATLPNNETGRHPRSARLERRPAVRRTWLRTFAADFHAVGDGRDWRNSGEAGWKGYLTPCGV
jgi:hypothetical protein